MSFYVNNGNWRINSPTSDNHLDVTDLNGEITIEDEKAVFIALNGNVGQYPVKFNISGAPLIDYISSPKSVPLKIETEFADNKLTFEGNLALPISEKDLSMSLTFETSNITNLNDPLGLDLPSAGPILFHSSFHLVERSYDMPGVKLQVADSLLNGRVNLNVSEDVPDIDIEFISEMLVLDDFKGFWAKSSEMDEEKSNTEAAKEDPKNETLGSENNTPKKEKKNPLSHDILRRFDAKLHVEAQKVTLGTDNLGSGIAKLQLKEGRLKVEPVALNIPSGGFELGLDYYPSENDVSLAVKAAIEKFDLGIPIGRMKPDSDMGGIVTLDVEIQSTAPKIKGIMSNADGHISFALIPKNFSAGIIDLWAVNLLSAIFTEVSEEEKSEINCLVARFGIQDGIMEEHAIYMDTSNMTISGKADVNFIDRNLNLMLVPKPKHPEFFSLAVPIKIEGKFDDFGLGIGVLRLTSSLFSFITSPIHVPVRRVFSDDIPEDGHEACKQAWLITGERSN